MPLPFRRLENIANKFSIKMTNEQKKILQKNGNFNKKPSSSLKVSQNCKKKVAVKIEQQNNKLGLQNVSRGPKIIKNDHRTKDAQNYVNVLKQVRMHEKIYMDRSIKLYHSFNVLQQCLTIFHLSLSMGSCKPVLNQGKASLSNDP